MAKCNVCGGSEFIAAEYKSEDFLAPALECASCHALCLDEEVARSTAERDSVRLAVATRAALSVTPHAPASSASEASAAPTSRFPRSDRQ
jgi:hypothetical protein